MHGKSLAQNLVHSRGSVTGSNSPPSLWEGSGEIDTNLAPTCKGTQSGPHSYPRNTQCPCCSGLTLDPQALLILDDEVLLGLLKFLQFTLRVLRDQPQLLKCLVDLKVFLGHGINQDPSRRGTLETDGRQCRQQ